MTQSIDVADFCNRSIQPTAAYLSTHDASLRPYAMLFPVGLLDSVHSNAVIFRDENE